MTPFLEAVAMYAPIVIVFVPLVALATVVWRRGIDDEHPLPLSEMLLRQGVDSANIWTPSTARQLAMAARRCASCSAGKACREWLDSGRNAGYEEFCVNAGFIERLK